MAYNKVSNKIQDKDVSYLNKDFQSFKDNLTQFAEVYFPNTHNDFTENNPSTMYLEMAAYVGDVLSFYTDTQLRETFLNLAQDRTNIYNLAYSLGYRPRISTAATVNLEVFQLVPSRGSSGNYLPDMRYGVTINAGSSFESTSGISFYLQDDIRFKNSSSFDDTVFSVYQYDDSNNPEYYLLKKMGKAISATQKTQTFTIGTAEKYKTITLLDSDILSIESIIDGDGNEYHEVDYLAQDTKFSEIENTYANDPNLPQFRDEVPYLLKTIKVPRRFVSRFKENNTLEIQFGAGTSDKADEEIIPTPDNIGLGIKDGKTKLDIAFDPSNFLYTDAYGQIPVNTTLTVTYLVGGGLRSNVPSNTITNVGVLTTLNTSPNLDGNLTGFIRNSIGVTNPQPAKGGGGPETTEEIRLNAMATFSAQQRIVTKEDYIIRTLSMHPKFGRIAKAFIMQDDQISPLTTEPNRIPNPLALNLYTLGYDGNKNLTTLNTAIKTNLSTYLERYRMLTDAVNIKDAFIINLQLDFSITTYKNSNNQQTLLECLSELRLYFDIDKWQINQPIIISEIENLIGGVKGVKTVEQVTIREISGPGYSQYSYDIGAATKNKIIYPSLDPSIFEIRYPSSDIKGRVTTY